MAAAEVPGRLDAEWDAAFAAAVEHAALTDAEVDALSDALAELAEPSERSKAMQAQLQHLAAGRLGSMLCAGQRVKLVGLKDRRAKVDGQYARVLCYDAMRGLYSIMTEGSHSLALPRRNLRIVPQSDNISHAMASGVDIAQDADAGGPHLASALRSLEAGDVESAVAAATDAVAADASDARAHLALADTYNMAGDLGRAIGAYGSALAVAPRGSLHWAKAAISMYECTNDSACPVRLWEARPSWMREAKAMRNMAETAVAAAPEQFVPWRMRSDAYLLEGNLQEAAASLERAIELCLCSDQQAAAAAMRQEVRCLDEQAAMLARAREDEEEEEDAEEEEAEGDAEEEEAEGDALEPEKSAEVEPERPSVFVPQEEEPLAELAAKHARGDLPAGHLARAAARAHLAGVGREMTGLAQPRIGHIESNPSQVMAGACPHADTLKAQGNEHLKASDLDAALEAYRLALAILADCRSLTNLDSEQGGGKGKIAVSEGVLRANCAAVLSRQGQHEAALREGLAAITAQPHYAKAHHRVGSALKALGREGQAQAAFRRSEELVREQSRIVASRSSASDDLRFTDLAGGEDPLEWCADTLNVNHRCIPTFRRTRP